MSWHDGRCAFTKLPKLEEIRLTNGGSPNLVDLLEWKVLVEWKLGVATISIHFTQDCTLELHVHFVSGFTLYKDTGDGRAATHQPYSSAI